MMNPLTMIKDKRFKNVYVSVRFLKEMKKEEVLPSMLLANVLNECCSKYDTRDKLSSHLDALYGASYSASCSVLGKTLITNIKTKTIHPSFIHDEIDLIKEQFKLLNEFIFHPCIKEGAFLETKIEDAKRTLKDHLLRLDDDPSTYCMFEAMKLAGNNKPLGWGVEGSVEDVDCISGETLINCYNQLLKESKIDILVFGDVEENEINMLVQKYLNFSNQKKHHLDSAYCLQTSEMDVFESKTRNITQAYITIIYETGIHCEMKKFASLRVANALFGQLPSSLLFQEIREKRSLCYSIYSGLFSFDGALAISTGVDEKNIDITLQLIETQLQRVQNGDFDDSLLQTAKTMLINSLRASNDDVDAIMALAYRNILFDKKETNEDVIANIDSVSKEDVISVMKQVKKVATYVLKKGEYHE